MGPMLTLTKILELFHPLSALQMPRKVLEFLHRKTVLHHLRGRQQLEKACPIMIILLPPDLVKQDLGHL